MFTLSIMVAVMSRNISYLRESGSAMPDHAPRCSRSDKERIGMDGGVSIMEKFRLCHLRGVGVVP